jgi:transposase
MPRAYPLELREAVCAAARDQRLSKPALAACFGVSESSVTRWLRRAQTTGCVAAKPHGGGRVSRVDACGAAVLRELAAEPHARTLTEIGALYEARLGVHLSRPTLLRSLGRLGLR